MFFLEPYSNGMRYIFAYLIGPVLGSCFVNHLIFNYPTLQTVEIGSFYLLNKTLRDYQDDPAKIRLRLVS